MASKSKNGSNKNKVDEYRIHKQYEKDTKNLDEFFNGKTNKFDVYALRRKILSELSYNNGFTRHKSGRIHLLGYSREQIECIVEHPHYYGNEIIELSRAMLLKSGYYKRLIEYFANMTMINWNVDTETYGLDYTRDKDGNITGVNVAETTLRKNYIDYVSFCNSFKLEEKINDIATKIFSEDVVFAYIDEIEIETDSQNNRKKNTEKTTERSMYFLDPHFCEIVGLVDGSVYSYAINKGRVFNNSYCRNIPKSLYDYLKNAEEELVEIPIEKSFCIKYFNGTNGHEFYYPPFFCIIKDILLIDDYKELAKSKTEADAYKLVYYKIPTNEDGEMTIDDDTINNFVDMTLNVIPETWGLALSPMDVNLVESKSTIDNNNNNTEDAVNSMYDEAGISKALIGSSSSGSELKQSIRVDSSCVYRIYRMIEQWMKVQTFLKGKIYKNYRFSYSIVNMTIFDIDDSIDRELKLAQASIPNKFKLCSVSGINPAKMIGNSIMENYVMKDIFDLWNPLKSSYTQSADSEEVGAQTISDDEISESGQQSREIDANDSANRDSI